MKSYYEKNKIRLSQLAKERYKKNKEEILRKTHIYMEKNKEKIKLREKQRYLNNCKILSDLKVNGCSMCGYNECVASLVFHHVNPEIKNFQYRF